MRISDDLMIHPTTNGQRVYLAREAAAWDAGDFRKRRGDVRLSPNAHTLRVIEGGVGEVTFPEEQ